MKFRLELFLTLLGIVSSVELDFKDSFKILQVSDTHYSDEHSDCQDVAESFGKCTYENTSYFLERSVEKEKPDLVVFTGDIVDWKTKNVSWSLNKLMKILIDRKIKWTGVLGNHDGEGHGIEGGRKAVMEYISKMPYSLSQMGPENVDGYGNYILNLTNSDKLSYQFVMMDSLAYTDYDNKYKIEAYDWVKPSQLEFVRNNTIKDVNKLAFFHIPIWEYEHAIHKEPISGNLQEIISPGLVNGGIFSTLVDIGNVIGIFVGHDHVNDFCALYYTIQVCYEGGAGYNIYGKKGFPRRHRVINILDKGDTIQIYKVLDNENLDRIDDEIIYSRNNPGLVESYMEKRQFVLSPYYDVFEILTLCLGIVLFLITCIFCYRERKNVKSCFRCLFNFFCICKKRKKKTYDLHSEV